MIRKMLVIAAAVAMPAASIAGISAVAGSGIASAKGLPINAGTYNCALTGSIAFPKPGLNHAGVVTNKLSETTMSTITPSGACGTKAIKSKIANLTHLCLGTIAVPSIYDPAACSDPLNAKSFAAGKNYAYGYAGSFLTAGASLVNNLTTAGLGATLNGNKVNLHVGDTTQTVGTWDGVTTGAAINPKTGTGALAHACPNPGGPTAGYLGYDAGFKFTGGTSITNLSYVLVLCMPGDTGTAITGSFINDLVTDILVPPYGPVINTAVIGGAANLTFTQS